MLLTCVLPNLWYFVHHAGLWTPLYIAVHNRNKEMTSKLLEGKADPNSKAQPVKVTAIMHYFC